MSRWPFDWSHFIKQQFKVWAIWQINKQDWKVSGVKLSCNISPSALLLCQISLDNISKFLKYLLRKPGWIGRIFDGSELIPKIIKVWKSCGNEREHNLLNIFFHHNIFVAHQCVMDCSVCFWCEVLVLFGNFLVVFGRGPGVPVCRYLSPLPAHLFVVFHVF